MREQDLPTYDQMEEWDKLASAAKGKVKALEMALDMLKAEWIKRANYDRQWWINGKPPTQMVLKAIGEIGFTKEDKELVDDLRERLAEAVENESYYRKMLDIAESERDVFRTISANNRAKFID